MNYTITWTRFSQLTLTFCAAGMVLAACGGLPISPPRSTATDLTQSDPLYASYLKKFYSIGADRKAVRNEYIEIGLGLYDRAYSDFVQTIFLRQVSGSFGVDLSILSLGAIGAGPTSLGAKTAASALSTLITGGKAAFDRNFLFDRTLPALISEMNSKRADVRIKILNGMLLDTDKFPLTAARANLELYYDAGSMLTAIVSINNQSAERQKTSDARLENRTEAEITVALQEDGYVVRRAVNTITTATFQSCVDPATNDLPDDIKIPLINWLGLSGSDLKKPYLVLEFITLERDESLRKRALDDPLLSKLIQGCKKQF